jgi:hypothetical protein
LVLSVPAKALAEGTVSVHLRQVTADSLPPLADGFKGGLLSLEFRMVDTSGAAIEHLAAPLTLTYHVNPDELPLTQGQPSRLHVVEWSSGAWQALPCNLTSDSVLSCTIPTAGPIASVIAPTPPTTLDWDLPGGHFYTQANGFGGSANLGYEVMDDSNAAMWTEFQRLGGVQQVGYPISGRFQYKGFLTQVFQRLTLQWRPELSQAVPVNVFDELGAFGADAWLDSMRQVPSPGDMSSEVGLSFDEVVAQRLAMLDPYPELASFYAAVPDALDLYGLPVAVKNYGPVVVVRLQRATLQLWAINTPFAAAGTVIPGNASDIAKEVGLWPASATAPTGGTPLAQ